MLHKGRSRKALRTCPQRLRAARNGRPVWNCEVPLRTGPNTIYEQDTVTDIMPFGDGPHVITRGLFRAAGGLLHEVPAEEGVRDHEDGPGQ